KNAPGGFNIPGDRTDKAYPFHRYQVSATDNTADWTDGCYFTFKDAPNVKGGTGASVKLDLEFKWQIIDTCNGDAVKAEVIKATGEQTFSIANATTLKDLGNTPPQSGPSQLPRAK